MQRDPVWKVWLAGRGDRVVDFHNRVTGSVDFRVHLTDNTDRFNFVEEERS